MVKHMTLCSVVTYLRVTPFSHKFVLGIPSLKLFFDAIAKVCTFLLLPPPLGSWSKHVRGSKMRKNPCSWG